MKERKWWGVYSATDSLIAEVQAFSKDEAEKAVQGKGYCYMGSPWAVKLPSFGLDDEMCNRIVEELMWNGPSGFQAVIDLFGEWRGPFIYNPRPCEVITRLCALVREGVLRVVFTPCESWEVV